MAALDGALALVEVDHPSATIAEDLHFDVAGLGQIALDEESGRAERRLRPPLGRGIRLRERRLVGDLDHTDAPAPAAALSMRG